LNGSARCFPKRENGGLFYFLNFVLKKKQMGIKIGNVVKNGEK
jgi:hypothetical protein